LPDFVSEVAARTRKKSIRQEGTAKAPACDADHIPKRWMKLGCIHLDADHVGWSAERDEEIQMRKISFTAIAAVMILIGFGVWAGALTTAGALSANPVVDPSGPTSAMDMPTPLVFPEVIGQ
jgi:hypothetical protein